MKLIQIGALAALFSAISLSAQTEGTYAGLSVGYLLDEEVEYVAARVGTSLSISESASHNVEVEALYSGQSYDENVWMQVTPITVNYRYVAIVNDAISLHMGAGAGTALIKFGDRDMILGTPGQNQWSFSESKWTWAGQLFAGVNFQVTERLGLGWGLRYLYISDINSYETLDVEMGGDVGVEVAARYRF